MSPASEVRVVLLPALARPSVSSAIIIDAKPFTDHTALVTRASGDIGAAIALALSELGAMVDVVARRASGLEALASRVRPESPPMLVNPADLTVDHQVTQLAERVRTERGRLDVLVHCAGLIAFGTYEAAPTEDFDRQYRANVRAPYVLTEALLPILRTPPGQIVFIGSSAALHVRAGLGQFAATQYAFRALADTLRDEVNGVGFRVLSVYPGPTATQRHAKIYAEEGRLYQPDLLLPPEDIAAIVTAALRLSRTAEVTDIRIRPLTKSY